MKTDVLWRRPDIDSDLVLKTIKDVPSILKLTIIISHGRLLMWMNY